LFDIDFIFINAKEILKNLIEKIFNKYTNEVTINYNKFIFKKVNFSNKIYNITDLLANSNNLEDSLNNNKIYDESKIYIEFLNEKTENSKFLKV